MGSLERSVLQRKARRMPGLQATPTGTGAIAATRATTTTVKVDKDGTTTVVATITQGTPTAVDGALTMDTAVVTEGMMTLVVPLKAQAIFGMMTSLTGAMIVLAVTTRKMDAMMPIIYVNSAVALAKGVSLVLALLVINAAGLLTTTLHVVYIARQGAARVLSPMTVVVDPAQGKGISIMLEMSTSRTKAGESITILP